MSKSIGKNEKEEKKRKEIEEGDEKGNEEGSGRVMNEDEEVHVCIEKRREVKG